MTESHNCQCFTHVWGNVTYINIFYLVRGVGCSLLTFFLHSLPRPTWITAVARNFYAYMSIQLLKREREKKKQLLDELYI